MKNIIFVMPTLRMGGAEKALVSLLKSLDPKRVKVDLFLFERGGVLEKEVPSWVKIIPSDPIVRDMTLELRNYFRELLWHRNFSAAITRLRITFLARLGKIILVGKRLKSIFLLFRDIMMWQLDFWRDLPIFL